MNELTRAIEFVRALDEHRVEQILPFRFGKALLTPSLPRVFHLNFLSVDLGANASAPELAGEAKRILGGAGLVHRKVAVDDQLGAALEPGFRALGWKVEQLLVMPHRGSTPGIDTSSVDEVEPQELDPVWAEGIRSSPEIRDEDEVRQLVAAQHGRRRAVHVRYFAARMNGEIASYCELFSDGRTAQIESVMTLEQFRGRGLATAVVSKALAEAKAAAHELTFLVADADGWPKALYGKLGFETAGSVWDFIRAPSAQPPATASS